MRLKLYIWSSAIILASVWAASVAQAQGICSQSLSKPLPPVFELVARANSEKNSRHDRNEALLELIPNLNAEVENLAADIELNNEGFFALDEAAPFDSRPALRLTPMENQAAGLIHLVTHLLGIPDSQVSAIIQKRILLRIPRHIVEHHIGFVLPKTLQSPDPVRPETLPYGRTQLPEPEEASAHLPIGFVRDFHVGSAPQGFIGFTRPQLVDDSFLYRVVPNPELGSFDLVRIPMPTAKP